MAGRWGVGLLLVSLLAADNWRPTAGAARNWHRPLAQPRAKPKSPMNPFRTVVKPVVPPKLAGSPTSDASAVVMAGSPPKRSYDVFMMNASAEISQKSSAPNRRSSNVAGQVKAPRMDNQPSAFAQSDLQKQQIQPASDPVQPNTVRPAVRHVMQDSVQPADAAQQKREQLKPSNISEVLPLPANLMTQSPEQQGPGRWGQEQQSPRTGEFGHRQQSPLQSPINSAQSNRLASQSPPQFHPPAPRRSSTRRSQTPSAHQSPVPFSGQFSPQSPTEKPNFAQQQSPRQESPGEWNQRQQSPSLLGEEQNIPSPGQFGLNSQSPLQNPIQLVHQQTPVPLGRFTPQIPVPPLPRRPSTYRRRTPSAHQSPVLPNADPFSPQIPTEQPMLARQQSPRQESPVFKGPTSPPQAPNVSQRRGTVQRIQSARQSPHLIQQSPPPMKAHLVQQPSPIQQLPHPLQNNVGSPPPPEAANLNIGAKVADLENLLRQRDFIRTPFDAITLQMIREHYGQREIERRLKVAKAELKRQEEKRWAAARDYNEAQKRALAEQKIAFRRSFERLLVEDAKEIPATKKSTEMHRVRGDAAMNTIVQISVGAPPERDRIYEATKKEIPYDPTIVDTYTIIRKLGEGSFGEAMLAKTEHLDQTETVINTVYGVVKYIQRKETQLLDASHILNEVRALRALKSIRSRFTTIVFAAYQDKTRICIAMEYLECGSIMNVFHKLYGDSWKVVPELEDRLRYVAVSLIFGLLEMHEAGMVHNDFYAANVLMDALGRIKISDFGRSREHNTPAHDGNFVVMPPEFTIPEYLSPKRDRRNIFDTRRSEYTIRSDYWSLGITLYYLATSKYPFNFQFHEMKQWQMMVTGADIEYNLKAQGMSADGSSFIAGLLTKDPESRGTFIQKIARHPWLANVNLMGIYNDTVVSPFRGFAETCAEKEK